MAQSAAARSGMVFDDDGEREPFAAYLTDDGSQAAAQVAVGDSVKVTGKVVEFQGLTEITGPTVTKLDAPVPAVPEPR